MKVKSECELLPLTHFCVLTIGCNDAVLPPIPTTGLTASDVSDLSIRVREQMLEALRELSGLKPEEKPEETPLTKEDIATAPAEAPSAVGTSPDPPLGSGQSDSSNEERTEGAVPLSIDTSIVRRDGSDQGTETEEDEGMVLVGRPTGP